VHPHLLEKTPKRVSGGAWRWLGWSGIDPATGRMERWPAEMFGPLPEWKQEGRH